jgi:signal peptidase I
MARKLTWIRFAVWFLIGTIVILAAWVTRAGTRIPSVYYMTGPSMEPTLSEAEYFIAYSPAEPAERGGLFIFRFEHEGDVFHVLRRIVALPGDTVAMDSGAVILNGRRQPWPFQILTPAASRSELAIEGRLFDFGPWVVPTDSVVLLADTRDMMGWPDSRFIGFVALADLEARAEVTLSGRDLRD